VEPGGAQSRSGAQSIQSAKPGGSPEQPPPLVRSLDQRVPPAALSHPGRSGTGARAW